MQERIKELEAQKDGAYRERDALVAALSTLFPSHLSRHPDEDATWDDDWRWIVCVHIPTLVDVGGAVAQAAGLDSRWQPKNQQVTWHIHDSELPMFSHLTPSMNHWDGHSTEEKYRRLAALVAPKEKRGWRWPWQRSP